MSLCKSFSAGLIITLSLAVCAGVPTYKWYPAAQRYHPIGATPFLPLPENPSLESQEPVDYNEDDDLELEVVERQASETVTPEAETPEHEVHGPKFIACMLCGSKEMLCKDKFCGPVCTESIKKIRLNETTPNCFVYCDGICSEEYDFCAQQNC